MAVRLSRIFVLCFVLAGVCSSAQAAGLRGPVCRLSSCVTHLKRVARVASQAKTETWGGGVPYGPGGGFTPVSLQAAYGLTQLSGVGGAGTTIGVVIAHNDPTAETDLSTWRAHYG